MNDLTLLYYSAHTLPRFVEQNFRDELIRVITDEFPVISVTQKPLDFGDNFCVGKLGSSHYNCYRQIYEGVQKVMTPYVAMVEDDTLYCMEHFRKRPEGNSFLYNRAMWFLEKDRYWNKGETGMFSCIAPTWLLRSVLRERFDRFPEEPMPRGEQVYTWQEPGRVKRFEFEKCDVDYFTTKTPLITLNYFDGLDGKKKSETHSPLTALDILHWGRADKLHNRLCKK